MCPWVHGTDVDEAYERHVRGRANNGDDSPDGSDDDEHTQPPPDPPLPWCRCRHCRPMPTQVEQKCYKPKRGHNCITTTGEFARLCLDHMVLEVAMRVNEDLMADEQVRNNAAYRHQAYRVFIYWQHGRLRPGNRRVLPSCAVWAIRNMFT